MYLLKIIKFTAVIPGILFALQAHAQSTGATITSFDIAPRIIPGNTTAERTVNVTFLVTINTQAFRSFCGSSDTTFAWRIAEDRGGTDDQLLNGTQTFDPGQTTSNFTLSRQLVIPSRSGSSTRQIYGRINCDSTLGSQVARSATITLTQAAAGNQIYGCIAADNNYACSSSNSSSCADAPACAGRPCVQVNSALCGQSASKYSCRQGTCVADPNGSFTNPSCSNLCSTGGGGQSVSGSYQVPDILGVSSIGGLIDLISRWIFNISIPIVVGLIIYAGVQFIIAAGNPGKVKAAQDILKWAVIGLAIVLIGRGFVTLIVTFLQGP